MQERQRITARHSELDALAEELGKHSRRQAERHELAVAERSVEPPGRSGPARCRAVAPASAKVAGRAVLLIPHRSDAADEGGPGDYRKVLAIVREADGPVQVRAVGERLGLDASVHGKLEPSRAKMTKLAARG
ncbi:hypothetical protein GCM10018793_31720 [Streptomyces sulfonofaciens]|uniref:Uncharacterized protein n=1 Tax=Streptomyces sulfonofaciens TaxID=68272 RepID=A0A919G7P4_9ACTN|nr:hypothetical protein [Streptomyces sulfonofaciens]GHH79294.1 hypothetical protein GCM10018793_31720 [Streptomyces sulfonofaciens]